VIELYSKDSKLFTILYLLEVSLLISPCEAVLFWWPCGWRRYAPTGRSERLSGRSGWRPAPRYASPKRHASPPPYRAYSSYSAEGKALFPWRKKRLPL